MKRAHRLATIVLTVAGLTGFSLAADIPPGAPGAKAALENSPRHGDWAEIKVPGSDKPMRAYVVYPERKEKAPVVIVIMEIFGLTDWIRAVADQLAADGFIAIAPDLIAGKGPNGGGSESLSSPDDARSLVTGLKPDEVVARLNATRDYGKSLPASNGKTATVGFCWGGAASFAYATAQPDVSAAVVFYGRSPEAGSLGRIEAPVLGNYGENDERVNATIEPTKAEMSRLKKPYTVHIYPGAGHGFLRQQDGQNGANLKAAQKAWPATVAFLKEHTK
jgi:carboxymethylenebutenolidase